MRNFIVASIAFVLLVGGFIVYMEIDKRKFIDSISPASPAVNQPVNGAETISEDTTQENEVPKLSEMSPDELVAELRHQLTEQFGYTDAVEIYVELKEKRLKEGLTIDERVAYLEASLYLYPSEATRKSLMLQRWLQSKGPNFDIANDFTNESIEELRKLGGPVVHRGDEMIVNAPPDRILKHIDENLSEKYGPLFDGHVEVLQSMPAPHTVSSEGFGKDTVSAPAHSEILSITPRPTSVGVLGKPDSVHLEKGHVHETPPVEGQEVQKWEGLSSEQQEQAKQLFDQYGSEEGLRRLRKRNPEAATQFERRRNNLPSRNEPPVKDREPGTSTR